METFAEGKGVYISIVTLVFIVGVIAFFIRKSTTKRQYFGNIMIPCVFIALAVLFYVVTFSFPEEAVGPAAIPYLWITVLIVMSVYLLIRALTERVEPDPRSGRLDVLAVFIGATIAYLVFMQIFGYYVSTFVFLASIIYLLSYRRYVMIVAVSGGWLLFAYFVFQKMLYIPLPRGKLVDMILQ